MPEEIARIKQIMINVSTGIDRIQNLNDEYIKIYSQVEDICRNNKIKNPNPYSDLWEFYSYWSKKLPRYADRRAHVTKLYKNFGMDKNSIYSAQKDDTYINLERLSELKKIQSKNFDLSKLIKICEEINVCYENKCYLALIILLRSLLNHIPPIFNFKTFNEVCGGYGKRSFKEIASRLNESSRKIADSYLHDPIRKKETLPNRTQINFSQELDYILAEIISIV